MGVLWVVAPCNLVEVYRRFRGAMIALMMEAASTINSQIAIKSGEFFVMCKVKSDFTISSTFDSGHLKGSPFHH
jgi:hypothetical protein